MTIELFPKLKKIKLNPKERERERERERKKEDTEETMQGALV